MSGELTGRKFIITGAATGMGAATLAAYARAGANVVGWYRNRSGDKILATLSGDDRARASFVRGDVVGKADVDRAVAESVEILGGLDGLINAAGISPKGKAESDTQALYDEVMDTNVRGTVLTNQAAFPHLKDRGGRIINFSSAGGINGYAGKALYGMTKGAVLAWTRGIAGEWAGHGITANCIAPAIWTPMYDKTRSEMTPEQLAKHDEMMKTAIPLGGRLGDAERDFAPMMVFLAGEGARFLTGQTYCIDGGTVMVR